MTRRAAIALLALGGALALASAAAAQVVTDIATDGSVGTAAAQVLPKFGNTVSINESVGERRANNLIHSFDRFHVGAGDVARFNASAATDNVISRVTGNVTGLQASQIFGEIEAGTNLGSASFYFLNPAGFVFGESASLDIGGSFHASTASQLRLRDLFGRDVLAFDPGAPVALANPVAFGFLGSEIGTITVRGSELVLPEARSLSFVAGEVNVVAGDLRQTTRLATVFGRINLATRTTAGEVVLTDHANGKGIDEASLDGTGTVLVETAEIDVSQPGGSTQGASIFLGGGQVTLRGADLSAFQGDGLVRLAAAGALLLEDTELDFGSQAGGQASAVSLAGETVTLRRSEVAGSFNVASSADLDVAATDFVMEDATIRSSGNDGGGSGDIAIDAVRIDLSGESRITASNGQANSGGNITLTASESLVTNGDVAISATSGGTGTFPVEGGDILLEAGSLEMHGGRVETGAGVAFGTGAVAGDITIRATTGDATFDSGLALDATISRGTDGGTIEVQAAGDLSFTDASASARVSEEGNAGDIRLDGRNVSLTRTTLQSSDDAGGNGLGRIELTAAEAIRAHQSTFDLSAPGGRPSVGAALSLRAPVIELTGDAATPGIIQAQQALAILDLEATERLDFHDTQLTMTAFGASGAKSDLRLAAPELSIVRSQIDGNSNLDDASNIVIEDSGSVLVEDSSLRLGSSDGATGSLDITAETIRITGASTIDSSIAPQGTGGDIALTASGSIAIRGDEVLVRSNAGGPGLGRLRGGRIDVAAPKVTVDGATIEATIFALGAGTAGDIVLEATSGPLTVGGGAAISASTEGGDVGGRVELRAPEGTVRVRGRDTVVRTNTTDVDAFFADGGDILLRGQRIAMEGGLLESSTTGSGDAGTITLDARGISLAGGARIESTSTAAAATALDGLAAAGGFGAPGPLGAAGDLFIGGSGGAFVHETASITIADSTLSTFADTGPVAPPREGSITVVASDRIVIGDGSTLTSSVGSGLGGDISVTEPAVLALGATSRILAETTNGNGGAITLAADQLVAAPGARQSADAGVGSDGEVSILAPEITIPSAALATLQAEFLNASNLLAPTCAARSGSDEETQFTVASRRGLPSTPEGFLMAFEALPAAAGAGQTTGGAGLAQAEGAGTTGVVASASLAAANAFRGGRHQEAEAKLREASALLAERGGDPAARAATLRGVAQAEQAQGDYQGSVATLQAALTLALEGDDRAGMAAALGSLGNAALALGRVQDAERYFTRGLGLAKKDGDDELAVTMTTNFGNQQAALRQHERAIASYEQAAALARRTGQRLHEVKALSNAARSALAARRLSQAGRLLDRAGQRRGGLPDEHESLYVLIHLARTHEEIAESSSRRRSHHLLRAHALLEEAQDRARRFGDDRALAYALGNLGGLYRAEQRVPEALFLTREAVAAAERAGAADALYRWHWQEGRLLWAQGRAGAAIAAYRRAVRVLEETRQETLSRYGEAESHFRRMVVPVYMDLVDALLRSSERVETDGAAEQLLLEARATVERFKAAEMRDYFRDECSADLAARSAALESVSERAAVIYPVVLDTRLEVLVSTSRGITRHTVPVSRERLRERVGRLRAAIEVRQGDARGYVRDARQLYDWLVRPYAERLEEEGIDTLVFAPDGPLRSIPMAVLMNGDRHLIDQYAVATTQSLSLVDPRPLERRRRRVLLAGVSDSVQGFMALPSVDEELEAVHERYGGTLLLNEDFRLDRMRSAMQSVRPSLVHIASHAVFTGDPDTSFVLAHDERMNMESLSALVGRSKFGDEPLELLVLSACETAAGDDRAGLGLAGVAIRAGARSALGSLWSISDDAAYELVVRFYEALDQEGVTKAEALRRAQLAVRADERFAHPFYWSPFLMINNWL